MENKISFTETVVEMFLYSSFIWISDYEAFAATAPPALSVLSFSLY